MQIYSIIKFSCVYSAIPLSPSPGGGAAQLRGGIAAITIGE